MGKRDGRGAGRLPFHQRPVGPHKGPNAPFSLLSSRGVSTPREREIRAVAEAARQGLSETLPFLSSAVAAGDQESSLAFGRKVEGWVRFLRAHDLVVPQEAEVLLGRVGVCPATGRIPSPSDSRVLLTKEEKRFRAQLEKSRARAALLQKEEERRQERTSIAREKDSLGEQLDADVRLRLRSQFRARIAGMDREEHRSRCWGPSPFAGLRLPRS